MNLGLVNLNVHFDVPIGLSPNGFAAVDYHCLDLLFHQESKNPECGKL